MQFDIRPKDTNHFAMLIITTDGLFEEELAINKAVTEVWGRALFWASDWTNNRFAREPLDKTIEWIENSIPELQESIEQFIIRWST